GHSQRTCDTGSYNGSLRTSCLSASFILLFSQLLLGPICVPPHANSRPSGGGLNPQDFHSRCAFIAIPLQFGICHGTKLHALPSAIPLVVLRRSVTRQYHVPFDVVQHLGQFPVLVQGHF